ncbi:MAG: enoyl-CoA hydratase/carnithine racemase [Candidatus Azotimanducaceae bacterium]|jgi:enoyl-CoA hydratase/carnithine racemase|tara:strand:+ start:13930 stop:14760 length:831 start_codon:yes stop_codon:yes gene_type:complete
MSNENSGTTTQNEYADIEVTLNDHVAVIEIQRPPYNFFDLSLIQQIADAFEHADNDPQCRVVVLAAAGRAFCAGANFGSGQTDGDRSPEFTEEGFQNTTGKLYSEAIRLFKNKKPIIAAIHGAAIGGGFGLACVADFRIASPKARFAANFVKLGLHQGFGISVTLPRLIGRQNATRLLLSGRRINAEEALSLGLVDEVVAEGELRSAAMKLALELAANAPLAIQSVRATMRQGLAEAVAAATVHELAEQQWLRATKDAYEGICAVSERRPGNFTGQ